MAHVDNHQTRWHKGTREDLGLLNLLLLFFFKLVLVFLRSFIEAICEAIDEVLLITRVKCGPDIHVCALADDWQHVVIVLDPPVSRNNRSIIFVEDDQNHASVDEEDKMKLELVVHLDKLLG